MRVRTEFLGRELPFERDRRIVLRRLPDGAQVTRAVLMVSPHSTDVGRRFLETITFPDAVGDWGAHKNATASAVEIDLRARRRLASLIGSNVDGGTLLVDLGGGYLTVNADGALGGDTTFPLEGDAAELPGLVATGLRIPKPNSSPDISTLRVASPPSNLTAAIEGGPVFWSYLGDLVDPATTPDFGAVLQGMLAGLVVENGYYVVPFVVHSDSIARLDLVLEVDFTVTVDAGPSGVGTVQVPYRYDGVPASAQGSLSVAVPPGMAAVAGGTTGRVQGAFESTRVVFGTLTAAAPEAIELSASSPLAQPFTLPGPEIATSVDLLLTAVTADVTVAVDIVDDLDGKPGRRSSLPRLAELTVSRDQAGAPTWVNVPLPGELEIPGGARRWLVAQAREGTATWSAAVTAADPATPADPGLQRTSDGGLSWRVVTGAVESGPLAGQLRLRHVTPTFHMPLELRLGAGEAETTVSLQQFAPQGRVDLDLNFPEVREALNNALEASGQAASVDAEHVANGDFAKWYRIGRTIRGPLSLQPEDSSELTLDRAAAFGPDGDVVYAAGQEGSGMRLMAFDVLCREQLFDVDIGQGAPIAMVVDAPGRHALVAALDVRFGEATSGRIRGTLVVVDTSTGRPIGVRIEAAEPIVDIAATHDGSGVYLLGRADPVSGVRRSSVRRVDWADLMAATGGTVLDWDTLPADVFDGESATLAVGPDGRVFVVIGMGAESRLLAYPDAAAVAVGGSVEVPTVDDAVDVAVIPSGEEVLVLGTQELWVVRASDLTTLAIVPLGTEVNAACLAIDPTGEIAVIIEQETVLVLDMARRSLLPASGVFMGDTSDGATIAMSPAGTHAVVTRVGASDLAVLSIGDPLPAEWELTAGQVSPFCLPASGEVLALLGATARLSRTVDVLPSAISQVVAVAGGTRYRFAFDGIAEIDGGVGEVVWRGDDCGPMRTDRVPVTVFDTERRRTLDRVPEHELTVMSPSGATQAEVRFFTPEGQMAVDHVSLAGTSNVASSTWHPTVPSVSTISSGGVVSVANGGAVTGVMSQVVAADAGQLFDLTFSARVTSDVDGAAIELAFADDTAAEVGDLVRVELQQLEFDGRAASGVVPDGAAEAELRIVVPPGGAVELAELDLSIGAVTDIGLQFVSDAPGDLSMTGVAVRLDRIEPTPAPMPVGGLCPVEPAGHGDDEDCYCGPCGRPRPVKREVAVRTDAGRPGTVATCPTCGSPRIRLGGQPRPRADRVPIHAYRIVDRPGGSGGPAIVARLRTDLPITVVSGIAERRATELRSLGITDLPALADAEVATVASLPGVTDETAAAFIAEANRIMNRRGERVIFEVVAAPRR